MMKGKTLAVYGPPGAGKTTLLGTLGSGGTIFVFHEESYMPAKRIYGLQAEVIECETFSDMLLKSESRLGSVPWIAYDDVNLAISYEIASLGLTGWSRFDYGLDKVKEFESIARRAMHKGTCLISTLHERAPKFDDKENSPTHGQRVRFGGPAIDGKAGDEFCALHQAVAALRPVSQAESIFWRWWLSFSEDDNFITKDRGLIGGGRVPPHLGELLRHQGYAIKYPNGVEKIVDAITGKMSKVDDPDDLNDADFFKSIAKRAKKLSPEVVRLGLMAGYARAWYMLHDRDWLDAFMHD